MAVTTTWKIEFGYYDNGADLTLSDLTSRCTGFSIDQQTDVARMGTGNVVMTFNNNDGKMTPGNPDSGLDPPYYTTWDWHARGVFISATISNGTSSSTVQVFHGVVTMFDLVDNGLTSTVTIAAADAFQVAGRQSSYTYTMSNANTAEQLDDMTDPALLLNATEMPTLGLATMRTRWTAQNAASSDIAHDLPASAGAQVLGDLISNAVITNGQTTAVPTILDTTGADSWAGSTFDQLSRDWSAGDLADPILFTDSTPLGAGELPFRAVKRANQLGNMTNAAAFTAYAGSGTAQTATDAASQRLYGTRSRSYTTTAVDDAAALAAAKNWVSRFAAIDLNVDVLELSTGMIKGHLADAYYADWAKFVNVENWFNLGRVQYTPTGGTQQTEDVLIVGRRFDATPNDCAVTLTLRPTDRYLSFILNDAAYGVLDQNRLG
tara:strand:+ start:1804 stop:3108 length:1305 start_codon:yes stop_codon:yes gene_type:complete